MLQTFNVPAGGRIINAKARFFRFESAGFDTTDQTLRLRADGQDLGVYLPGDSITLPIDAKTWEVAPASATQTSVVRLGIGTVQTARLLGVVQVVDTNKARTIAANGFAHAGSRGASAGVFARCGIVNPTGNTKRAIVERLSYSTGGAATTFGIGFVPQASLAGIGAGVNSKLSGGAVSSCLGQADSSASFQANMTGLYARSGTQGEIALATPIVVLPGFGLVVNISTANQDAFLGIDFFEESLSS